MTKVLIKSYKFTKISHKPKIDRICLKKPLKMTKIPQKPKK